MVIVVSARSVQSCAGLSRNGLFGYLLALRADSGWLKGTQDGDMQSGTGLATVAFMHQFLSALLQEGSELLQKTYEVSDMKPMYCVDEPRGWTTF